MNAKLGFSHHFAVAIFLTSTLTMSAQDGGQTNQPAAEQEPKAPRPGGKKGPYFYNQRLDQQAQQVQKMASDITNSQLFQAELDNLDLLSKYSSERIFSSARRAALATLEATFIWRDISERLKNWQDLLNVKEDDWKAQQQELKNKIAAAKSEIEAARPKSPAAPQVLEILESAADANEFFKLADGLVAKNIGGLDGITTTDLRIAKQLADSAGRVAAILTDLYKTSNIPTAQDAVRGMKVSLLQAELEHIANQARIESGRESAMHDMRLLLQAVSEGISCLETGQRKPAGGNCLTSIEDMGRTIEFSPTDRVRSNEQIEYTLRRFVRKAVLARRNADACLAEQLGGANRDCGAGETTASDEKQKLQFLVYLLQNWSSLAARAATPGRLAAARLAQEERRFSIRRDAILARSYEAIIGSGAQRLATYYRGGIKPETIAQFVQALSTAGLIPTVALK